MTKALEKALIALGAIILLSYVGLAIVHARTLYDINQTSGAWLSFAFYLDHGVFYPPLFDGAFYAGTRYFPGFFALHALFAKVTGEYLVSGKLLTYLSTLGAIAALARILARKVESTPLAIAIASIVLATYIGHKASLTIRGDVLPLALSLASLSLLEGDLQKHGPRLSRTVLLAALLAGLAPLAKFTSFHALTAGFLHLVQRDRKRAFAYGAIGFAIFVAGTLSTNVLSDGRFFANLTAAAVAPEGHKRTLLDALSIYILYVRIDHAFVILLPFALFAFSKLERPIDLYRIYFVLHAVIAIGFFFDTGAEYNHLIDLVAATVILASEQKRSVALAAFGLAGAIGLYEHHLPAWTAPERGVTARALLEDELGLANKTILAHDPTVSVLLGRRPVVADDFQYRVLVMRHAIPEDELPARIRAHAFDRVVLLNAVEPDPEDPEYLDRELGPHVARAIREQYVLERHVAKFYVYAPRPPLP